MNTNQRKANIGGVVNVLLTLWFALVLCLGIFGAFTRPPGTPPLPILAGAVLPIIAFLVAYRISDSFRDFVLAFDLRLAAGMQAWRFAGFGFLALWAYGVLPGVFAWPAGVGDMAIGLTAPWIILALIRRPGFAGSRSFMIWNWLGILDLVVAIGTGGLNSLLARGAPLEVTTSPMSHLPLVFIPAYLVPIFVMLHLSALFQARRAPP